MTSSAYPEHVIRSNAWVHTASDGTVTSNWIKRNPRDGVIGHGLDTIASARNQFLRHVPGGLTDNADFFWIAHLKEDYKNGAPWVGFADKTNSEIDMFEVWKLYVESTGGNWQAIAAQWPEHVKAHEAIAAARAKR